VLTLFTLGGQSFAVVELAVAAGFEHLLTVAAADYRFAPVGLVGQPPFAVAGIPAGTRLAAGDHLTVIVATADLDRLLRRESPPRGWRVVVDSHPLLSGETLAPVVRDARGCSDAEAAQALCAASFCVAEELTRGEADELLRAVERERATAHVEFVTPPAPALEEPASPTSTPEAAG
jgi:hypothetical protein